MAMNSRIKKREVLLPKEKHPAAFTEREKEILQMIWAGLNQIEIAERLKISVRTVAVCRANMMKKVRVSNIAQLVNTAIQEGLFSVESDFTSLKSIEIERILDDDCQDKEIVNKLLTILENQLEAGERNLIPAEEASQIFTKLRKTSLIRQEKIKATLNRPSASI